MAGIGQSVTIISPKDIVLAGSRKALKFKGAKIGRFLGGNHVVLDNTVHNAGITAVQHFAIDAGVTEIKNRRTAYNCIVHRIPQANTVGGKRIFIFIVERLRPSSVKIAVFDSDGFMDSILITAVHHLHTVLTDLGNTQIVKLQSFRRRFSQ